MTTTDAHIRRMSAAMSGLLRASTAPQRRIKHGIRAVAWPAPSSSIPFGEPAGTTPGAGAPCSAQRSLHSKGASQEGHTQDAATAPLSTCLSSFTSGPFALTPPADLGPAINTADGGLIIWHTHTQIGYSAVALKITLRPSTSHARHGDLRAARLCSPPCEVATCPSGALLPLGALQRRAPCGTCAQARASKPRQFARRRRDLRPVL